MKFTDFFLILFLLSIDLLCMFFRYKSYSSRKSSDTAHKSEYYRERIKCNKNENHICYIELSVTILIIVLCVIEIFLCWNYISLCYIGLIVNMIIICKSVIKSVNINKDLILDYEIELDNWLKKNKPEEYDEFF